MADNATASRFARALVELAQEEQALASYSADMTRVGALFGDSSNHLTEALSHPGFSVEERMAVLEDVLTLLHLQPMVANFLRVVQGKGRARLLPLIVESFFEQADTAAGRVRATVTSAHPLTTQLRIDIRTALQQRTGREVVLLEKVNPSIIGGLIAEVEGRVYDASLRARLDALRQQMLDASFSASAEA